MTNTQLIAEVINTWMNENSTDYKDKYDLTAVYNPLEQERVDSVLDLFLGDPDSITKQQIEVDKIRGVVQAGIGKKNEVSDIDASTPAFQVSIRTDVTNTGVEDDVRAFIEAYNGLVTKETLASGTYYFAWGFNTFEPINSINRNGVRFLTLVLSGEDAITRQSASVRAGHFGDDFTIAITPPLLPKQSGVDVISITPTYTSNIERDAVGTEEDITERYVARDLSLSMILTRDSVLGKHYIDVLLGQNLDANSEIEITWDNDTVPTVYTWENAILTSLSVPIQLGKFIFIIATYAKTI